MKEWLEVQNLVYVKPPNPEEIAEAFGVDICPELNLVRILFVVDGVESGFLLTGDRAEAFSDHLRKHLSKLRRLREEPQN